MRSENHCPMLTPGVSDASHPSVGQSAQPRKQQQSQQHLFAASASSCDLSQADSLRSQSAPPRKRKWWFRKGSLTAIQRSILYDRMVSRRLVSAIAAWHDIHSSLLQLSLTRREESRRRRKEERKLHRNHHHHYHTKKQPQNVNVDLDDRPVPNGSGSMPKASISDENGIESTSAMRRSRNRNRTSSNITSTVNDESLRLNALRTICSRSPSIAGGASLALVETCCRIDDAQCGDPKCHHEARNEALQSPDSTTLQRLNEGVKDLMDDEDNCGSLCAMNSISGCCTSSTSGSSTSSSSGSSSGSSASSECVSLNVSPSTSDDDEEAEAERGCRGGGGTSSASSTTSSALPSPCSLSSSDALKGEGGVTTRPTGHFLQPYTSSVGTAAHNRLLFGRRQVTLNADANGIVTSSSKDAIAEVEVISGSHATRHHHHHHHHNCHHHRKKTTRHSVSTTASPTIKSAPTQIPAISKLPLTAPTPRRYLPRFNQSQPASTSGQQHYAKHHLKRHYDAEPAETVIEKRKSSKKKRGWKSTPAHMLMMMKTSTPPSEEPRPTIFMLPSKRGIVGLSPSGSRSLHSSTVDVSGISSQNFGGSDTGALLLGGGNSAHIVDDSVETLDRPSDENEDDDDEDDCGELDADDWQISDEMLDDIVDTERQQFSRFSLSNPELTAIELKHMFPDLSDHWRPMGRIKPSLTLRRNIC